jgi:hypothetical protein
MHKKIILFLLLNISFTSIALSQNDTEYPIKGRMELRADSMSRIIDRMIAIQKLLHFTFSSKYIGDTATYYRNYYIDTLNGFIVKCIIDTTFEDYYKRIFRQAVIYFNQGYEFKSCYNVQLGVDTDICCSYYNIIPEEGEITSKLGQLDKNWTYESIDSLIRNYISSEIYDMKFMQKRNNN